MRKHGITSHLHYAKYIETSEKQDHAKDNCLDTSALKVSCVSCTSHFVCRHVGFQCRHVCRIWLMCVLSVLLLNVHELQEVASKARDSRSSKRGSVMANSSSGSNQGEPVNA